LPNVEQAPLYNAYNAAWTPDSPQNLVTSGYNALAVLLCPSDNQKIRPNYPWAPMNYAGNAGGPGVISWQDGTIVDMFTCMTSNMLPTNGWTLGQCWWSANANFGYFGFEGVTDGSSNTALFSERLVGLSNQNQGSLPTAGSGVAAKRGIFLVNTLPNYTVMSTGNQQLALQGVQMCQGIPGTQQPDPNNYWVNGYSWTMSFPWHIPVNRYTHNNTPNKLTCFNPNDQCCGMGGTDPMATATSNHPGGVNVCFTDGSVRFVKDSVGPQVWWALGSRNLGEVVSSDSY